MIKAPNNAASFDFKKRYLGEWASPEIPSVGDTLTNTMEQKLTPIQREEQGLPIRGKCVGYKSQQPSGGHGHGDHYLVMIDASCPDDDKHVSTIYVSRRRFKLFQEDDLPSSTEESGNLNAMIVKKALALKMDDPTVEVRLVPFFV